MTVELRPHQVKALKEIRNGSILKGGVGTGKSITAVAYFTSVVCGGGPALDGSSGLLPLERPRDLYIITTAKKRNDADWISEVAPFRLSTEREASLSNVSVTVDSWNNIANYSEVKDAFFVFDEQRLVGSGAWVKAFLRIANANQWIMLSATPGDVWLDYCPLFIAHGFYKNRTEFLRRHVVYNNFSKFPKIDHYVETGILEQLKRRITVDMPYERHTVRHVKHVVTNYDHEKFALVVKKRWNIFEDAPIKDVAEMFRVMRKLVNSDVSRLGAIMELTEKHPRLIVFYNFNYELDMLRTLANTLNIRVAEWNGQKHEELPEGDRWIYLVQYTAGAEGWNCITTDAIAFFSLNYSYKLFEQAKGRIDRLNTPFTHLYYYVMRSTSQIDAAIWRSLTGKESFNEAKYAKKFDFSGVE